MKELTKDEFFEMAQPEKEFVTLDSKGRGVWVHGLTADQRDKFELSYATESGRVEISKMESLRAKLVYLCAHKADGNQFFESEDDVVKIGRSSGRVIDKLYGVAQKLSGMTAEDEKGMLGN